MIPKFFKKKHYSFYYSTTSDRPRSKATYIRIIELQLTTIPSSVSLLVFRNGLPDSQKT